MIDTLSQLNLQSLKPILAALMLPPVPMIFMILLGAALMRSRKVCGWGLIGVACVSLWLSQTVGWSDVLARWGTTIPEALSDKRIAELRRNPGKTAIVVLGGGVENFAPEYGAPDLADSSFERLRYAMRLSRATQIPIAFSGGVGWAGAEGPTEAAVATRIAASEFVTVIKWTDDTSRDTQQNAAHSVHMLKDDGIQHLLIVTHGWHMRRAMHHFKQEVKRQNAKMTLEAAPMGLAQATMTPIMRWMPSGEGAKRSRRLTLEIIGQVIGRY